MKTDTIQTTFTGGEFSPSLFGRTDITQYANACATVQNMLIRPFGSIISSPGTEFINACKTGGTTSIVRLIPFTFSQTDSYIIEMGVNYFRFYTNGAVVVSTGTTPYEIPHPYLPADISTVQYCQFNDVIYLTHTNYPPATLTRLGSTNWQYSALSFTGGPFMPENNTAVTLLPSSVTSGATISLTVGVPTWASGTNYSVGSYILSGSTLYQCVIANNGGNVSVTNSATVFTNNSSVGNLNSNWTTSSTIQIFTGYGTSYYLQCTGFGFSIPTNATIQGVVANFTRETTNITIDNSVKLCKANVVGGTEHSIGATWPTSYTLYSFANPTDLWGLSISPADVNNSGFGVDISISNKAAGTASISNVQMIIYYNASSFATDLANGYWQVASGIFQSGHVGSYWSVGSTTTNATTGLAVQGYVQVTSFGTSTAVTATVISLLSTAGATTLWAEGSWSSVRGWPASCAFFQSRLFMARTNSEPQTVWGSKDFQFTNFAVDGGADNDALNLPLTATQSNDIKWLSPMNDLIVGSYGGEFAISSGIGTGNPLTPATAGVTWQTPWGAEPIVPRRIGNYIYYVQRYFQKLREVFYIWTSANYKSVDKTILSPQIAGGGFVDMAYQQNPDTILWMVCSNGTLATMTREVDQEVQGWSRQVTAGSYSSIAAIPSQIGAYDEVWVIVSRTINGSQVNYIERFGNHVLPLKGDYSTVQTDLLNYTHCGLSYNAFSANTTATLTVNNSLATDGGFESWSNSTTLLNYTTTAGTLTQSTVAYAGTYSACLISMGTITQTYSAFAILSNNTLTLSCVVSCGTAGIARIQIYDGLNAIPSPFHPGDGAWHTLVTSLSVSNIANQLTYFGQLISAGQANFDSLTLTTPGYAVASSAYFSSTNVGERIRAVDAYDTSLGEIKITAYSSSTAVFGSLTTTFSTNSYSPGLWGVSVKNISGLSYLQAASVVTLGDGSPAGTYIVTGGAITLTSDYFVVTVGLQATQILQTLKQEAGAQRGTAQGKVQRINNISFKLNNSYQGFSIAGLSGSAYTLPTTSTILTTGVLTNITYPDGYQFGQQTTITNTAPLPIEILSIMTEIDTQEK